MPSGSTGHRRGAQGTLLQSPVEKSDGVFIFNVAMYAEWGYYGGTRPPCLWVRGDSLEGFWW